VEAEKTHDSQQRGEGERGGAGRQKIFDLYLKSAAQVGNIQKVRISQSPA